MTVTNRRRGESVATVMGREQLLALPAVLDVPTAAGALGLSKTAAYELIRCGSWPTPVFRLGKLIRIPTAPLLVLLGIEGGAEVSDAPGPGNDS